MRVLVCGGRYYGNRHRVREILNTVHKVEPISLIIEGGAKGADRLARFWAIDHRIKFHTYEAQWTTLGRAAGHWRNKAMLTDGKPDLVIAFPGGPGTADMLKQTRQAGLPCLKVKEDEHGQLHEVSVHRWRLPEGSGWVPWVSW